MEEQAPVDDAPPEPTPDDSPPPIGTNNAGDRDNLQTEFAALQAEVTRVTDGTKFNDQTSQTFNFGLGMRVILRDWAAVQVEMRDHIFSLDLLGKDQTTHNLELTAGVSFYF